jgi:hypothetical protein
MASRTVHRVLGNLYLNDGGDGVIHADGGGLLSESVSFDSLARGTPGSVAVYKDANPDAGILTTGIPKSSTTLPGAMVQWGADGSIDGVALLGGIVGATTVNATTVSASVVDIQSTPVLPTNAATVDYVNTAVAGVVGGFAWQLPVINFEPDPALLAPADGDRYIALATIGPWTRDSIYEWDAVGAAWVQTLPVDGMGITSLQGDPVTPLTGPTSYVYTAGAGWLPIGFNGMHDSLVGKKGTTANSSDFLLLVGPAVNAIVHSWPTLVNRVWAVEIDLMGASNAHGGTAHFHWEIEVVNHSNVATFSIIYSSTSLSGDLGTSTASLAVKAAPDDEFLDVRVSVPSAITSTWHATIEGTYTTVDAP